MFDDVIQRLFQDIKRGVGFHLKHKHNSPGAFYMIKKVAVAAAVTNLFCFGALFWWEMAVAIKILFFDELVGPS